MTSRLRSESGNALAIALGTLSVLGVLTASVAAVSVRVSDSSTASRDAKRALSVADAGMNAAIYRMNKQNVQLGQKCFTTALVDPVDGVCPGYTESLGNGSSYTYYVSKALTTSDRCAGMPVQRVDQNGLATVVQRCVTSVGAVNGERRRVQARIVSYEGAPIFPRPGIIGLNGVTASNNSSVNGYIGSNGTISLGNNSSVTTFELAPSAPNPSVGSGSSVGQIIRRPVSEGSFVLAPVDIGNSATVNDNLRIPNGLDTGSGSVTYSSATRSLTLGNGAALTFGGGTYNFCKVTMGNNTSITIAAGAKIRIFIDSPDRTESGCIPEGMTAAQARAADYGSITMGQGSNWVNTGDEASLQIYVYGWDDGSQTLRFNNSSNLLAAIYAPQSRIEFNNSGVMTGGVVGREVVFRNGATFAWGQALTELRATTLALYYRSAWSECSRQQTVSADPTSGCS